MPSVNFSREILKTTVFRFAPETQKLKSDALDQIVLNAINKLGGEAEEGEITSLLSGEGGITPSPMDVVKSLDRLYGKDKVVKLNEGGKVLFRMTTQTKKIVDRSNERYQELLEICVGKLLTNKDGGVKDYVGPFSDVLAYTFAELGDECVSVVDGDTKRPTVRTSLISTNPVLNPRLSDEPL